MSKKTASNILSKVQAYIQLYSGLLKSVNVTLFGGEPLLVPEIALFLLEELQNLSLSAHVVFNAGITTNALYCEPQIFTKFRECGLTWAQITFDGPETIHNKRRRVKNEQLNSYRSSLDNIPFLVENLESVAIKYNFDLENWVYFESFLEDLASKVGDHRHKVKLVLEPIQNTSCNEYHHALHNDDIMLAEQFVQLVCSARRAGFKYEAKFFSSPCMYLGVGSYLISPTGEAYSCVSAMGEKTFEHTLDLCGNITSNCGVERRTSILEKHCSHCPFLPTCFGGCAYELFASNRNIDELNCRRSYYEHLIRQLYSSHLIPLETTND